MRVPREPARRATVIRIGAAIAGVLVAASGACQEAGAALSPPDPRDPAAEVIGDTLTVIQRPLLNIPTFVTPGGTFSIECEAPSGTTGWSAEIIHGSLSVPLGVTAASYDASTRWWRLTAEVPTGVLGEIFDLSVTASGGLTDVARHAVKVLPSFRSDYYFVHITDTHLPTHLYYYQPGASSDSVATGDLRAVINDINIINPEFVLHTGDLVN
jgi:hypothetical protein